MNHYYNKIGEHGPLRHCSKFSLNFVKWDKIKTVIKKNWSITAQCTCLLHLLFQSHATCCRVLQHCVSLNNVCEEILQDFSVTPSTLSCPCFPTRVQFNHQFSPSWERQNTDEVFSYTVVWRKWKACQVCGGWKQMLQYNVKLLQLSECQPRKCTIHITFEKGCRNIERWSAEVHTTTPKAGLGYDQ